MDLYTGIQQALNDPALAIITEDISTQKELNGIYFKYRALPKKQKRYSNYYSNKFLGHTVTEMYVILSERMKAHSDVLAELPSESYVVSEPDLYYNEEAFNSGKTNICFILGHSGSGKSVMARALEGDDIDHIELDDLLLIKDHFTMDELKEYSDMYYDFFSGEGAKYYIGDAERENIPKEEYEDKVFVDFVRFAKEHAKRHKDKKYILDGIWIYLYFDDPSIFEDNAVFIKGTSFLKSKVRTMKRETQREKEEIESRKKMFGREVRNYLLDEEKIDSYRKFFSDKPETIRRFEENEATQTYESVNNEMNLIDRCFVEGDADGIKAIMEKAQANNEISGVLKLAIITECQSALSDLGV